MTVREAVREDAGAISRVRVETWRAAYTGLMAAEILDRMDVARETQLRRDRWDELHADPRSAEPDPRSSRRDPGTHRRPPGAAP